MLDITNSSSTYIRDSKATITADQRVDQAAQFLTELAKGIPDDQRAMVGYASEANVQTDAEGRRINSGWWPEPWKEGKYVQSENNAYVCISSSIKTPHPTNGRMRYWRGEASFGHGLALMVDDIGTGTGSKGTLSLEQLCRIAKPTAIVETSPGNHQLWYFLDKPEPNMPLFKAFLYAFAAKVLASGGDATIKDVSRYGRLPCGVNNKRHADGSLKYPVSVKGRAEPFRVSLVEADYSRRYSVGEIAARFGFNIAIPKVKEPTPIPPHERRFEEQCLRIAVEVMSAAKQGEKAGGAVALNGSGKYRVRCPWAHEHATEGTPYSAYFRGPIPGAEHDYVFGCAHNTCKNVNKRTWSAFVDEVVMPKVIADLERINQNAR